MQRTAVEAAVGQANLRKGVNQVFLNLSLRNQSLLHRQLAMLDAMERATRDPAALDDLFRLDHLTTRMRRHAEGLIILSGATPGRGWRDPVPVIDVLRAAIAEVEDYVRVDVASESRDAVVGAAVNDVIHLLAELVENATAFSPPNTRVEIRADAVGDGLAIEIEDRGLGLSAEELAEINAAPGQPARVRPGRQRPARPVRGRPAGRPARDQGLAARLALRRHHRHRADAAQPDRAGRRGGPGRPRDRAGQHRRAAGRGQRQRASRPAATGRRTASRASAFSLTGRHRPGADSPEPRLSPAGRLAPSPDPAPAAARRQPRRPEQAAGPLPAAPGTCLARRARRAVRADHLGLPRRVRQASLAPQLRGHARTQPPAGRTAPADLPAPLPGGEPRPDGRAAAGLAARAGGRPG